LYNLIPESFSPLTDEPFLFILQKSKDDDDEELNDLIAGFKINDAANNKQLNAIHGNSGKSVKKLEKGSLPILYTDKTPYTNRAGVEVPKGTITGDVYSLPRTVIMAFFKDIISMLLDEENIDQIVRDSWSSKLPLHQTAMEFQRDVMVSHFHGFTVYYYGLFFC
jgi:hypothetical protein